MDVNVGRSVTRGLREGTAIIVSNRSSHNGGSCSLDDSPIEIVGLPIQQSSEEEEYREVQQELSRIKDEISQLSKKNFSLEKDLKFLDSKIALLINHKVSIEEVESQLQETPRLPVSLKDVQHHEEYVELFLTLQTNPEYIAKLTRLVSQKEIDGLLQIVMFSLYGNHYENREEYLLLSMFEHALTYEVQDATEINSLMRANTAITRMMTTYCRRGPGQEFVRNSLQDIIKRLVDYNKPMEIDPLKIYQQMVEANEIVRSDENNIILAEVEENVEVKRRIQDRIPVLQEFVLEILETLKKSIDTVPFGIRWLCRATKALVQEKFQEASSERINSFIGGFFFLRYINPIIVTPHAYRLLTDAPSPIARRNLTLVAKLIQKLANTSSVREAIMLPLEPFVKSHNDELKAFLSDLCEVSDFHEQLQLEEYIALSRKDIAIDVSTAEIHTLQSLLLKYRMDVICSSPNKLAEILEHLPPLNEDMQKRNQPFKLKLCQRLADPGMSHSPLVRPGSAMNVTDQLASARRKCKHLLIRLFKMVPSCMQEDDLHKALKSARVSIIEEVVTHAKVITEQLQTLQQLGGLNNGGKDLYEEVRAILPDQTILLQRSREECTRLETVLETVAEHSEFLQEQLEAYKAYLEAVRAKVGEVPCPPTLFSRKPKGTYKFSHSQLEKEGIVLDTPGIPMHRRGTIFYCISCSDPGIYCIEVHQKGGQKPIYERQLHLEDLLEVQHLQDPVINLEGLVTLNVHKTLTLLSRQFMRKEPQRPVSRHFSAHSLTFTPKS